MRTLILAVGVSLVAAACAAPVAAAVPSAGRVTSVSRVTPAPAAVVLAADQAEITVDVAELI